MQKKILCMLLALSISLAMLAACNNEVPVEDGDDGQQVEDNGEEVSDTLTLVSEGNTEYVIVYGENATPTEKASALEIQNYLKQISGVEVPVVTDATTPAEKEIVVGKTNREADGDFNREELTSDGFVIKTSDSKLWLVGGGDRGTIYSVYEFLEAYLGCRYYTSTIEKIPEMKTVSIEPIAEDKQVPIFEFRDHEWADYRLNPISIKHKFNGAVAFFNDISGTDYFNALNFAGGSHVHNLQHFVPAETYFESNPEWFSLNKNGKRNPDQLCLSNEEAVQKCIDAVKQWLNNSPNAELISVSQNDNSVECYCDECLQVASEEGGTSSGIYMRFVNKVADAIKEEYPNILVDNLAYRMTRGAPTNTAPSENVMIRLCSFEVCFSHPLNECIAETNDTNTSGKTFVEDIKDWTAVCDHVYIWDYTTNYSHYLMPFPNFDTLRQNMALYADLGVDGVFSSGNYNNTSGEFGELRCYLLAKLQWDPYMSEEEYNYHMKDFLQGVYGPGWESVLAYLNLTHELTADRHMGMYYSPAEVYGCDTVEVNPSGTVPSELTADMIINYEKTDWTKYWNWYKDLDKNSGLYRLITEGETLLNEAVSKAENDVQKQKLEKLMLQIDYLKADFRGNQIDAGNGAIGKLVREYYNQHSEEFDGVDFNKLRVDIIKFVNTQIKDPYMAENKAFAEKCLSFGVSWIREGKSISNFDTLDFSQIPEDWYE